MDLKVLESIKNLKLILEERGNLLKVNYFKLMVLLTLSFLVTLLNNSLHGFIDDATGKLLVCICVNMNVCMAI